MVLNAGGEAPESGPTSLTSCFFFRAGEEEARVVLGNDGNIEIGDTYIGPYRDGDGKTLMGYYTPISGWAGFAFGSIYSVGRICNIDVSDASTKPLTDVLLSKMFARFPASKKPTHIAMSTKCGGTLQRSRTTYSPTGNPAPWPTNGMGSRSFTPIKSATSKAKWPDRLKAS